MSSVLKMADKLNLSLSLVQILAWHRIGDRPLSEPMLTRFTNAYMRYQGGGGGGGLKHTRDGTH